MMCPLGLRRAAPLSPPPPPTTILMGSDVRLHLACLIDVNTAGLNPSPASSEKQAGSEVRPGGVIIRMAAPY